MEFLHKVLVIPKGFRCHDIKMILPVISEISLRQTSSCPRDMRATLKFQFKTFCAQTGIFNRSRPLLLMPWPFLSPAPMLLTILYYDVIMGAMASQITSLTIVYSTVYAGADQRKYQSSASLAFVMGIHRWPVNSPHKGPVTQKMFQFDDVIITYRINVSLSFSRKDFPITCENETMFLCIV